MKEKKAHTVKLVYDLKMDDVLVFLRYNFKKSPKMKRSMLLFRTLIPAVICVVLSMALTNNFREDFSWQTAAIIGACYVLGFIVIPSTIKRSIERATKKMYLQNRQKDLLGAHKTILDGTGIVDESRFGTARYPWDAIVTVARTGEFLYLYLSPESAIIIPLRNLKEGAKRDSLFSLIEGK